MMKIGIKKVTPYYEVTVSHNDTEISLGILDRGESDAIAEELIQAVLVLKYNLEPEDVFSASSLEDWAESNGYIRGEDEAGRS